MITKKMSRRAARVAKGAEFLDRQRPGWASRVATDRLVMSSCRECILGQLYGEYTKGLAKFFDDPSLDSGAPLPDRVNKWAGRHGFTFYGGWADFAPLADLWRAEIQARLA